MKNFTTHSKSGLFLMEMIFVLLFLGLTCGICVRLFAATYQSRQKAREYDHIQELTTSIGEVLEGSQGRSEDFLVLFPDGIVSENTISCYFDKKWESVSQEQAVYQLTLTSSLTKSQKSADLLFQEISSGDSLYQQTIRFPVFSASREVIS